MPLISNRAVLVARGLKAFLNLEVGVTRGEVSAPNRQPQEARPPTPGGQAGQLARLRKQVAEKDRRLKALNQRVSGWRERVKRTREQLVTDAQEIRRLQMLVYQLQSGEKKRRLAEPVPVASANGRGPDGAGAVLYLDLMKRCLKDSIYGEGRAELTEDNPWPSTAHTMIGFNSLDNLQFCVEDVLANDVPGDFIETGVWRGGASILMRAVLKAHGVTDRTVWVADSFEGLPPPDVESYPHDADSNAHTAEALAISLETVRSNFELYGLLDDQVRFLKGWFSETLPDAPVERLAVARLDGDMYESTMDALTNLYPRLSIGGYLIIDDYGALASCRQAVHDYREAHGIDEEIVSIDQTGVYWRRTA